MNNKIVFMPLIFVAFEAFSMRFKAKQNLKLFKKKKEIGKWQIYSPKNRDSTHLPFSAI
jgi:hypothetical protein